MVARPGNPGDIAFVLTSFSVLQGYLRDVGMHVRNLQRSVNDMEELVDLQSQALGIADRPEAKPIRITKGRIDFENIYFHYGNDRLPLYNTFRCRLEPANRLVWSAPPAPARPPL